MSWKDVGQELEDFVQNVYSASLKNEHLKNAKIEKNHIEIGRSGAKHEFDVFYEIKIAGIYHRVGIECKNHNRKITKGMLQEFKAKLDDCNNIRGFMVSAKGYQEGAKTLGKHYGIELINADELPNIYGLLLAHTECLVPNENVYGDPFWTIMQLTEDGKNAGSYYSPTAERMIVLFLSKKSAERVLTASGAKGHAVFGVSRPHLRAICYMSKFFNAKLAIASKLRLEPDGRLLTFEHSYDEILTEFDME
ncbi:restriction endonuclease [Methanosarcina sp. DH2]|uniref:restriction endonuclease n=1 Tax=Methanosarcina sp. DH2 TaxID=2605639 RepID=UPI001E3D0172